MAQIKLHGKLYEVVDDVAKKVVTSASVASASTGDTASASVSVDANGNAAFSFTLPKGD